MGCRGGRSGGPDSSAALTLSNSEPAERRAHNGDIGIAYWVYGEGQPLLLLTGLAVPASAWGPLPTRLAGCGYQVVVIDNRDSGRSSACPGGEYSVADMAGDVLAVMDELGLEDAYVVGVSMGGFIAQELALGHPDRVSRLMLVSTGPGIGGGVAPETEMMIELFATQESGDPEKHYRKLIGMLTGPGWSSDHESLVDWAIRLHLRLRQDPGASMRQWLAVLRFSTWERLHEIRIPTLILHGDKDRLVPFGNGQRLASRIGGAQLVRLERAGHLLPLERPQETVSEILRFFPRHEADVQAGSRPTSKSD